MQTPDSIRPSYLKPPRNRWKFIAQLIQSQSAQIILSYREIGGNLLHNSFSLRLNRFQSFNPSKSLHTDSTYQDVFNSVQIQISPGNKSQPQLRSGIMSYSVILMCFRINMCGIQATLHVFDNFYVHGKWGNHVLQYLHFASVKC